MTPVNKTSESEERLIIAAYLEDVALPCVARKFQRSPATIRRILLRNGIKIRPVAAGSFNRKLDDFQLDEIVARYNSGESPKNIAQEFGICVDSISYNLRVRGIKRFLPGGRRIYDVNDSYFDEVDTPEKAFYLGFIAADGCVCEGNTLQIELQIGDADILFKMKSALKSQSPISYPSRATGRYCKLKITSDGITAGLLKHGIAPRKSLILEPWNGPQELLSHYWHGFVCGDGSIVRARSTQHNFMACGTLPMMASLQSFIMMKTLHYLKLNVEVKISNPLWRIATMDKRKVRDIVSVLSKNAPVWMDRKWEIMQEVLSG